MLKNILFAAQTVLPAGRIEGARNYLGRNSLSAQDMAAVIVVACIAAVFALFIIADYIKQKRRKK